MNDTDPKGLLSAPYENSSSNASSTYSASADSESDSEAQEWPRQHQQSRTIVPSIFSPPNFDHFTTQFHLSQLPSGSTVPDFFAMNDPHCFDLLWTNHGALDDIELPQLGGNVNASSSSSTIGNGAGAGAASPALPRVGLEKSSSFAGSIDTYTSYEESVSDDSVDDFDASIFHPMGSSFGTSFGPSTDLASGVLLTKDSLNFHFDDDIFASGIFDALA
jgi:hypothetical protein